MDANTRGGSGEPLGEDAPGASIIIFKCLLLVPILL